MTKVGRRVARAALIARADKRAPLVIQLARYCPMILDRPPIHRFNAVEHVPGTVSPHPPTAPPRCPPLVEVATGYDDKWREGRSISPNLADSIPRRETSLIQKKSIWDYARGKLLVAARDRVTVLDSLRETLHYVGFIKMFPFTIEILRRIIWREYAPSW